MDTLQKDRVDGYEANKQQLRQLENVDLVKEFQNYIYSKRNEFLFLLFYIEQLNPHSEGDSFKNKIDEIKRDFERQNQEFDDLIEAKKNELLHKGLSPERIQQFYQYEAGESPVGDQCQVCLEEVEVGRLMKQLDCGGRHSFCSGCIDQWFADHKTCPIFRHVFE